MIGMIFLDDKFNVIDIPLPEKCTQETWNNFTDKIVYAFFDIPERHQWFRKTYKKFDKLDGLFDKTETGLYSYDKEDEYWSRETDRETIYRIGIIYSGRTRHPLSGKENNLS